MNNTQTLIDYILKTMPKVIYRDLGKVLVNVDFRTENKLASEHFGIPYDAFRETIRSYFHDYVSGNISNEQIDGIFRDTFGITESVTAFQHSVYHETISLNDELLEILPTLPQEIHQSIISNIFPDTLHDLQSRGILDQFENPIYSCEVGMAKPDTDIFYHAMTLFPDVQPSQCLFVDDKNHNLEAAATIGIETFRYTKYI